VEKKELPITIKPKYIFVKCNNSCNFESLKFSDVKFSFPTICLFFIHKCNMFIQNWAFGHYFMTFRNLDNTKHAS